MKILIKSGEQNPIQIELRQKSIKASYALKKAGVFLDLPCAGKGICQKCRIKASGELSLPTSAETSALSPKELESGIRLACQTELLGDSVLSLENLEKGNIVSRGYLPSFQVCPSSSGLGIAADIGTTTLALYLVQLETGEILSQVSRKNPQSSFGGDVISRIQGALSGSGQELQDAVTSALDSMILEACAAAKRCHEQISACVLAGNTAMLYLLCGESPASIAAAPFHSEDLFGRSLPAKTLGICSLSPDTPVYLPRCIGAYLGADITAALLSSQLEQEAGSSLLLDLGTNGEIILKTPNGLYGCSTAAGPAFEGVGLYQGMQAAAGAIDAVWVQDQSLAYTVIGCGSPSGICGSGIISLAAALLELGILDNTGRIVQEHPYAKTHLHMIQGQCALEIEDTGVLVTQKDIRSLQLAKSAVCAGILTLLYQAEISITDLSSVLLAGGFGSYLNVSCGEAIGLFPKGTAAVAKPLGNASGMGAFLLLINHNLRPYSERLAQKVQEIDLAGNPYFQQAYVDCMLFGDDESEIV